MVFLACKKDQGGNYTGENGTGISGRWKLVATSTYHVPGGQAPWQPADLPSPGAIIQFTNDSVFLYNSEYLHREQGYDHYMKVDSTLFYIIALQVPQGGNFAIYHASAQLLDGHTLEIHYMGVDAGLVEEYTRN
jgi:hypothetical protein